MEGRMQGITQKPSTRDGFSKGSKSQTQEHSLILNINDYKFPPT